MSVFKTLRPTLYHYCFIALSLLFFSSQTSHADCLSDVEKGIFGNSFSEYTLEKRISRIEKGLANTIHGETTEDKMIWLEGFCHRAYTEADQAQKQRLAQEEAEKKHRKSKIVGNIFSTLILGPAGPLLLDQADKNRQQIRRYDYTIRQE
jgi:hypothetical protein